MGLFGKIKDNLNHGGIKIELTVPDQVDSQSSFKVQARLTGSDTSKQVNSATAYLERIYLNNREDGSSRENNVLSSQAVAGFTLEAGQVSYLEFELTTTPLSGTNPTMQQFGSAVSKFTTALDNIGQQAYAHQVKVVADVEGLMIDPSAHQQIKINGQEAQNGTITKIL